MSSKFYVTTPIYYANDLPHIGHLFSTTVADSLARYYKIILGRENVFFTTGLDEHGTTVEQAAKRGGFQDYQKYVDQRADFWTKVFDDTNISFDYFVRTTNPKHKKFVKEFLDKLNANGDIYKGKYKGKYCYGCEKFLTLSDLNDKGLCPLHRPDQVIEVEEENYFFKLSKYSEQVKKLIEDHTLAIQPAFKQNEILSRIEQGIEDQSISRPKEKVRWGIDFPYDRSQTIYVWFEALLNYLSSLEINHKSNFWDYSVHVIGKDINWFHNLIWPSMLIAAGYPVQKGTFVHSFLNIEGKKISKSLGNVISPYDLINRYGVDGTRYLLLANTPYHRDVDVTWDALDIKYNADLANGLGNLIARTAKLCENSRLEISPTEQKLDEKIGQFLIKYQFNEALKYIWDDLIRTADITISESKPWDSPHKKAIVVLTNTVNSIRHIAYNLQPFLPRTAEKILQQFHGPQIVSQSPLFPRLATS